jgi:hypothetical protein
LVCEDTNQGKKEQDFEQFLKVKGSIIGYEFIFINRYIWYKYRNHDNQNAID